MYKSLIIVDDVYDDPERTDSNDSACWEAAVSVPMQFNRLVLFRPLLWHSAGDGFGDSTENGRLVQLFFLRAAPRADASPRSS